MILKDRVLTLEPATSGEWRYAHDMPAIHEGELHVWLIEIDPAATGKLAGTLSDHEIQRADRFKQPEDRIEFIVSRGLLRAVAGKYLAISPGSLDILYTKDGKPLFGGSASDLKFNVSHSGDYVLLAFSRGTEIGVDIERHENGAIDEGTITHSLHPKERLKLGGMSGETRTQFFFDSWTRKEAFLKLLGCGFAIEPTEVNLSDMVADSFCYQREQAHFAPLPLVSGYSAAIATKCRPTKVHFLTPGLFSLL